MIWLKLGTQTIIRRKKGIFLTAFVDLEKEYNLHLSCSRHVLVDDVNRELTTEEIAEFRNMFQTLSHVLHSAERSKRKR